MDIKRVAQNIREKGLKETYIIYKKRHSDPAGRKKTGDGIGKREENCRIEKAEKDLCETLRMFAGIVSEQTGALLSFALREDVPADLKENFFFVGEERYGASAEDGSNRVRGGVRRFSV